MNRGSRPILVQRIETSCPCLTIEPRSLTVGSGEKQVLGLAFDPSGDLDFRGGLAIEVTGFAGGAVAFQTLVKLEVEPGPSEGDAALEPERKGGQPSAPGPSIAPIVAMRLGGPPL